MGASKKVVDKEAIVAKQTERPGHKAARKKGSRDAPDWRVCFPGGADFIEHCPVCVQRPQGASQLHYLLDVPSSRRLMPVAGSPCNTIAIILRLWDLQSRLR